MSRRPTPSVKAVLRGIRGPIDAAKQGKMPATAGLAQSMVICSQASRGMEY